MMNNKPRKNEWNTGHMWRTTTKRFN